MANEEKQIKVNLDPVLYGLSNVQMSFNDESFNFLMVSGNQARQFQTSPQHAKRISMLLDKYISSYEDKHGLIETKLPENNEQSVDKNIGFNS